jgi:DNA polymerase III subunit gamma/tau
MGDITSRAMSLYRKYRPSLFADVIGQEHIKQTLQNEILQGTTVHAYLFSGPRAVGKTTTARILARAVNCTKRSETESEPCNDCDPCTAILNNKSLDIIEIDAASHTGVDNVRDNIIAAARVAHSGLKYKVFIVDEVHMLSISAFNALLKLLEEPPTCVIFILATTELHKVPATIVSRCQRFDFRKIPADQMRARLQKLIGFEKKEVDEAIITEVIRRSGGFERDAESLLGQILALHETKIDKTLASVVLPFSNDELVAQLATSLVTRNTQEGIRMVNGLLEEGIDMASFINDLIDYCRDILLIQNGAEQALSRGSASFDHQKELAGKTDSVHVVHIIDCLAQAQKDTRWFSIPQLPLEMAVVRGCATVPLSQQET